MKVRFYTCDVFTRDRFGGNPLAVVPDAVGLSSQRMQQIAREFNYSETTFVLPPEQEQTRRVRIFTPTREVPFAGHPNIGTAFVLASIGELDALEAEMSIVFEEKAGLVPVTLKKEQQGGPWCELQAPQGLTLGETVKDELAAAALCLAPSDISSKTHAPCVAGVGLPFLIVEVKTIAALARAWFSLDTLEQLERKGVPPDVLVYARTNGDFDIRARMFAPLDGVPEDPATGSANCALAALLTHCHPDHSGEFSWRISQGVEMNRPSILNARTTKQSGQVTATYVGGDCVMICEGFMETGDTG